MSPVIEGDTMPASPLSPKPVGDPGAGAVHGQLAVYSPQSWSENGSAEGRLKAQKWHGSPFSVAHLG